MTDHDLIQEARRIAITCDAPSDGDLLNGLADALEAAAERADQLEKALGIEHERVTYLLRTAPEEWEPEVIRWLARVPAEPATEEQPVECDGGPYCAASPHRHGCFADRGDCDEPGEHAASSVSAGAERTWQATVRLPYAEYAELKRWVIDHGGEVRSSVHLSAGAGQVPADTEDDLCRSLEALRLELPASVWEHHNRIVIHALEACRSEVPADTIKKARALAGEYDRGWRHDTPIPHQWAARAYAVLAALVAVDAQEPKT